ncbi:hypothetical protein ACQPYE_13525 [Actinosynnema sp. CA-299493]
MQAQTEGRCEVDSVALEGRPAAPQEDESGLKTDGAHEGAPA